jgi:glycerol-3-phosphate dehydrogenase
MRGLSVALIERDDFGSGLSFNHQRTVHGGLRALQSGDVRKTREQIAERRAWAIMAPHLVRPLPFLLGTYGWGARSRAVLGTGLSIYDWLGRRRNGGMASTLHLPNSRTVSRAETMRLFPGIRSGGLTGGAIWHDYQARASARRAAQRLRGIWYSCSTQNMLVRRDAFEQVGGFDETYRTYGFEDRDLLLRLGALGSVEWAGDAVVEHHDALTLPGVTRKMRKAGGPAAVIFSNPHPEAYRQLG